jgi:hypothetical protein
MIGRSGNRIRAALQACWGMYLEENRMNLIEEKTQYRITSGPSKFDLMLALFDGSSASKTLRPVSITIHAPEYPVGSQSITLAILVNSVSREDGSGESWTFHGHLTKMDRVGVSGNQSTSLVVSGYYSTKSRTGHIYLPYS